MEAYDKFEDLKTLEEVKSTYEDLRRTVKSYIFVFHSMRSGCLLAKWEEGRLCPPLRNSGGCVCNGWFSQERQERFRRVLRQLEWYHGKSMRLALHAESHFCDESLVAEVESEVIDVYNIIDECKFFLDQAKVHDRHQNKRREEARLARAAPWKPKDKLRLDSTPMEYSEFRRNFDQYFKALEMDQKQPLAQMDCLIKCVDGNLAHRLAQTYRTGTPVFGDDDDEDQATVVKRLEELVLKTPNNNND